MKTLLIITNSYPPCRRWPTSTRRLEGFCRYLPEFGWRSIVLNRQCACMETMVKDDDSELVMREIIESSLADFIQRKQENCVVRIGCKPNFSHRWWLFLEKRTGVFKPPHWYGCSRGYPDDSKRSKIEARIFGPIKKVCAWLGYGQFAYMSGWPKHGFRAARMVVKNIAIDAVLSSSPHLENHLLAAKIKKKLARQIPWIADVRDSLFRCRGSQKWAFRQLQNLYLSRADLMVHVTDDEARRDYEILPEKFMTVENGFLEEEMTEIPRVWCKNLFVIRYLGELNRWSAAFNIFCEGLRRFIQDDSKQIFFEYYGCSQVQVTRAIEKFSLEDHVRICHSVDKREALRLMSEAAVLLHLSDKRRPGCPGAKFYEYLAVRKPILTVGGREAYTEDILKKTGCGVVAEDAVEVEKILRQWRNQQQKEGSISMHYNNDEIMQFSRRRGTKKLADAMNRLIEK